MAANIPAPDRDPDQEMYVVKRDGSHQDISPDKVLMRLRRLCHDKKSCLPDLNHAQATQIALKTIAGIHAGVTTSQLDHLAETLAQPMSIMHPDNDELSSRIKVSAYHKDTTHRLYNHFQYLDGSACPSLEDFESNVFTYTVRALYENLDDSGMQYPLIHPRMYAIVLRNAAALNGMFDYWRDYQYDCSGFATMEKSYLFKCALYFPKPVPVPTSASVEPPSPVASASNLSEQAKPNLAETLIARIYDSVQVTNKDNKVNGSNSSAVPRKRVPVERPQHMLMRVAIALACHTEHIGLSTTETTGLGLYNWQSIRMMFREWQHYARYRPTIEMLPEIRSELISNPDHLAEFRSIIESGRNSWTQLLSNYLTMTGPLPAATLAEIRDTYELLSKKLGIHATPTLFAAGTMTPQLSSCFLITPAADSLAAMGKFVQDVMQISKYAGGIGSHHHKIRSRGAYIRGTNGISKGLPGFLQIIDKCSFYVDQGGGKRPGTHAPNLSIDHADVFEFLSSYLPRGNENERTRGLQGCSWLCDEFMRCLSYELDVLETEQKRIETWYLMCPDRCPGLNSVFDEEFVTEYVSDTELSKYPKLRYTHLYRKYVRQGCYSRRVSAIELWNHICHILEEKGIPYLCYKDAANRKTNQDNLDFIIESTNLCTEIYEVSTPTETAVCNLASIVLHMFVVYKDPCSFNTKLRGAPFIEGFETDLKTLLKLPGAVSRRAWIDFDGIRKMARTMIRNLNHVIDSSFYPIVEAKRSNMRHRPLGLGVMGWADMLTKLRLAYDDELAYRVNWYVFEALYYGALEESMELAKRNGYYESFPGCAASRGLLQQDLWEREQRQMEARKLGLDPDSAAGRAVAVHPPHPYSLTWSTLRADIVRHGLRNSLLVAMMPTASTGVIMGNSRSCEPHFATIMKLRKDGEDLIILKQFQLDMLELGLWTPEIRNAILKSKTASVSEIKEVPELVQRIYRNAWDLGPKPIINQAADRHWFIDQGQSMNLFLKETTPDYIAMVQFYAWRKGLKTGSYYTRGLAAADAQKMQLESEEAKAKESSEKVAKAVATVEPKPVEEDGPLCRRDDPNCLSCQ